MTESLQNLDSQIFFVGKERVERKIICDEAIKQLPMEHREFTLGEIPTSTFLSVLSKINGIQVSKLESLSQEAPPSLAAG